MSQRVLPAGFARIGIFADLTDEERAAFEAELEPMSLQRGEVLVCQGEDTDALYIVVSGRFDVRVTGRNGSIAEIGPGSPVGEIAFLAGGVRTATVTAVRDSLVLRLERGDFDRLCRRIPRIWETLTTSLARRLADQTTGRAQQTVSTPRTIALIRAGKEAVPLAFIGELAAAFERTGRTVVIDGRSVTALIGDCDLGSSRATETLNSLEGRHDTVIYVADPLLTAWSEKAIRQADLVLRVGLVDRDATATVAENVLETFAGALLASGAQRLVLLHPKRRGPQGTRYWLASRSVGSHHHVALGDRADVDRLVRFVTGSARGLVACGGGAFCAAHVGLYKALSEADVSFDIMGGTSGGSAIAAGFAMGRSVDEIDRMVHEIFVRQKALRRYTWPRFSLLDHTRFDRLLEDCYGGIDIEDLWLPYFAVSTNLSRYGRTCHARGSLWEAVRASSSIPALLPPYYTLDGEMLVDGALVDNVPVRVMRELKAGPNVVIAFEVPQVERFAVNYRAFPSRTAFIKRALLPFSRNVLPDAPSLGAVLMRSMLANRNDFERHLQESDLLMVPPVPAGMSILDWGRHGELMQAAYVWGLNEIGRARTHGHPAVEMFSASSPIVTVRGQSSSREQM
ncbi:MAG: patatin-like phospholipase family protein [Hyphomicrobiaceae bacterium]